MNRILSWTFVLGLAFAVLAQVVSAVGVDATLSGDLELELDDDLDAESDVDDADEALVAELDPSVSAGSHPRAVSGGEADAMLGRPLSRGGPRREHRDGLHRPPAG